MIAVVRWGGEKYSVIWDEHVATFMTMDNQVCFVHPNLRSAVELYCRNGGYAGLTLQKFINKTVK